MTMRQAIVTTYHGPTNTRGSRVKAKADAGSIWWNWDHALGIERNHRMAALNLAEKLGWSGHWVGGGLPGSGYVFVQPCDDRADSSFDVESRP
jgi:hypothetical protein